MLQTPGKWFILAAVSTVLFAAGCAGAKHRTKFDRNDALILDDGTLVIKGFGADMAGSITCVVRPGAHGSKTSSATKAAIKVLEYASGEVSHEATKEAVLLYAQTERLAALDSIFAQYCMMFGNGVFGPLNAPTTFERYNDAINILLDKFSGVPLEAVKGVPAPAAPAVPAVPAVPAAPAAPAAPAMPAVPAGPRPSGAR